MNKTTTAQRLREVMNKRNLKQVDILELAQPLCEKYNIKLGKSALSQFLSGKYEPGQWKLTILGKALNVNEAWLMGYDVPMERTPETDEAKRHELLSANRDSLQERAAQWVVNEVGAVLHQNGGSARADNGITVTLYDPMSIQMLSVFNELSPEYRKIALAQLETLKSVQLQAPANSEVPDEEKR